MTKVVDCHSHYWPKSLLNAITATPGKKSHTFVWSDPACSDLEKHIEVMDNLGIDAELLLPSPMVPESFVAAGINSDDGMRVINDAYAEAMKSYPGRFIAAVAVDPFSGKAALKEIERGVTKLGLKAISLKTSYDGLYVDDQQFWPIHQLAQELGVPIIPHPVSLERFWKEMQRSQTALLRAEVAILVDTTICIGRFVRYGLYDRFPNVDYLFFHLGGMIPMLFGRFDLMNNIYANASKESVGGEAIFPLKSLRDYRGKIMADSHSMDRVAIECAAESLGADCVFAGGDYPLSPSQTGPGYNLEQIRATRLSTADREKILGGNATRIFKLEA